MNRLSTIARLGAAAAMLVSAVIVGGEAAATDSATARPAAQRQATSGLTHGTTSFGSQTVATHGQRGQVAPKDGYLRAGTLMSSCGNMDLG